jgi:hypothetical protein
VEREVLLLERAREERRALERDVEAEVRPPRGEPLAREEPLDPADEAGLGDVQRGDGREAAGGEVVGPAERGRELLELPHGELVVDPLRIALLHPGERGLRERGLDPHHRPRAARRRPRRIAGEPKHARRVHEVPRADVAEARLRVQVVVAVGEAETARVERGDDDVGVLRVGLRGHREEGIHRAVELPEKRREVALRAQVRDQRQIGRHRRGAEPLHARLVHARAEEVAHLLLLARAVLLPRELVEQPPEELLVLARELRVDVPARLVGRDRVRAHPAATGVGVEVGARIRRSIHRRRIEPGRVGERRERTGGGGRGRGGCGDRDRGARPRGCDRERGNEDEERERSGRGQGCLRVRVERL